MAKRKSKKRTKGYLLPKYQETIVPKNLKSIDSFYDNPAAMGSYLSYPYRTLQNPSYRDIRINPPQYHDPYTIRELRLEQRLRPTNITPKIMQNGISVESRNEEILADLERDYGGAALERFRNRLIKEPGITVTLPDSTKYDELQDLFNYVNSSKNEAAKDSINYNANVDLYNSLLANPLIVKKHDPYAGVSNPLSNTPVTDLNTAIRLEDNIHQAKRTIHKDFWSGEPKQRGWQKGRIHTEYPFYDVDYDTQVILDTPYKFAKATMQGKDIFNNLPLIEPKYEKFSPIENPALYEIEVESPKKTTTSKKTIKVKEEKPSKTAKEEPKTMAVPRMEVEKRPVTSIKMPGGNIMSKEDFIKRYGQKVWDEQNKTPKLQDGGFVEATAADSSAVAASSQALLDYYKNYTLVDQYGNPLPQGSMFDPKAYDNTSSFRILDVAANYMKDELAGEHRDKPKYPETYRSRMQGIGRFEGDTSFTYNDYRQDIDFNKFKQREVQRGIIDERAPMALYDRRILPQGQVTFKNEIIDNHGNYDMLYDDMATVVMYDPIAVTPWNQLSSEQKKVRLDKYGTSGTPMDPNKIKKSSTPIRPAAFTPIPARLTTQTLSDQLMPQTVNNDLTAPIPQESIIKDLPVLTPKASPIKEEVSFTAKGYPMIDAKNRTTTTVPEGEVWNEKRGWHRKMQEGGEVTNPDIKPYKEGQSLYLNLRDKFQNVESKKANAYEDYLNTKEKELAYKAATEGPYDINYSDVMYGPSNIEGRIDTRTEINNGNVNQSFNQVFEDRNIGASSLSPGFDVRIETDALNSQANQKFFTRNNATGYIHTSEFQDGGEIKEDYNIERAKELGYTRDETGHLHSVDHETGMWLKSKEHPTAYKEFISMMLNPDIKAVVNPEGYFGENQLQYISRKENGGEVSSEQSMQQELPYQEIVSYPIERTPFQDPRVPKSADKSYYKNLYNTDVPKTLAKQYQLWANTYKSPIGLNIDNYKDIYDTQAFFKSGKWRKGFKNIEEFRKPSHPMLGTINPETNTFIPDPKNINSNEEIASYILKENIPVKFREVERIPINPDGFAPGSATENADKVIIPSNSITTKDMKEPILANGEVLMPGEEVQFDSPYVLEEKLTKAQNGLKVDNTKTSMPIDPRFLESVTQEAVEMEKFEKLPEEVQEKIMLQQQINDPEFRSKNQGELYKGLTDKEKISNFMSDLGTEFAYSPRTLFTLEYPTFEEKQRNRSVRKDDLGEVWKNRGLSILDGLTWFMGGELFGAGLGKAGELSIPYILGAEESAKKAIGNTYKLNPWAFKPQEGMMYRGLGKEGFEDAIQSGVFRPKQQGYTKGRSISEIISQPKQFGKTYYAPHRRFDVVQNYGPEYIAEVPFEGNSFNRRYKGHDWSWKTRKQIPIEEGRILQKDWLRGYKPVDISKTSGSAMRTNPPKNIDELLALPEEEILNLTGKQKWVWENFKSSSLPKERIEKELARALSREESLIGQFTVPQNTVPRELRDFVKEGRKDAIDWIKSDEWLKRRIKATGESKEQAEAMRKIMLEDLKSTTVDFKNVQGKKVSELGFKYIDQEGKQRIALGFGDDAVNKSLRGNAEHEFIHAGTNNPKSFQGIKMDDIYPEIPSHLDPNTKRFLEYLNQNTEKQVRGVRTLQYLKRSGKWDGSSEITDDMINHLKDNYFEWSSNGMGSDVANLISNVKDKKTLKDFLNNVYTTSGIIAGGAAGSAGIKD